MKGQHIIKEGVRRAFRPHGSNLIGITRNLLHMAHPPEVHPMAECVIVALTVKQTPSYKRKKKGLPCGITSKAALYLHKRRYAERV